MMRVTTTLAAAVLAVSLVSAAQGQETCITCVEPEATYRCTIEKVADKFAQFGAAGEKALQLICVKELARQGGHRKCTARRDRGDTVCQGATHQIPWNRLIEAYAPSTPPPAVPSASTVAADEPKVRPTPEGPPKTMLELAERAGESSKQQLKKVGDGVGTMAERTWSCITSLFARC